MSTCHSNKSKSWRVHPNVRFRRLFDEAVVLHQKQAEAVVLNDSGAAFLELCDGEHSFEEIIELLCMQFQVEAETLRDDIVPFARELQDGGYIVASGSQPDEDKRS